MVTNFFLGANSSSGFQDLYRAFVQDERNEDVMVLKGGPGVGKSSLMKELGRRAEAEGEDVEYIWCSGDPDSLDAVHLPRLGIIAVDGTSPHVVEPRFPAAVDRYVNLGRFYDVEACKAVRDAIVAHTLEYQGAYVRAYRALQAAGEVDNTLRDLLCQNWDRERLEKRTEGILGRELSRWGDGTGQVEKRFLGGLTCKGAVYRFDTVDALADRVYVLLDSWGLGDLLLRRTMERAVARGYDVIACPDENHPQQLLHLIIPQLRLAFVTSREGMVYPGTPYRRLHLDALLDSETVRSCKTRCRFYRRMRQLMAEEAVENLREAKASHDLLEGDYHPTVDFRGVYALAEEEWQRIRRQL